MERKSNQISIHSVIVRQTGDQTFMNLELQIQIITNLIRAINKRQKALKHTRILLRQKAHILKGKEPTYLKAESPHT